MTAPNGPPDDEEDWQPGLSKEKPKVSSPPSTPPADGFPVVWLRDAKLKLDARPIVKGLIDPGAFVVIYGPSGSGKSFFAADLAQHIATGQPWRGRKVKKGLVVYIASEAGASILRRFVGWRDNRMGESAESIPLAILTRGPDLMNPVQIALLCDQLARLQEESGLPLVLVVFDTLSRSMPGADENSTEDMSMAVNVADYIRQRFDAASAYVHHTGKDSTKGPRGAYALYAAADLVLLVQDRVASVEKVRDGLMTEKFPFTLEPVEIGRDADDDPVMTCLLNVSEAPPPTTRSSKEPTGKNQRLFFKTLRELVASEGQAAPETSVLPRGVRHVRYSALVDRMLPKMPDLKQFTARQRLSSVAMALQDSGLVGVHGDLIWIC